MGHRCFVNSDLAVPLVRLNWIKGGWHHQMETHIKENDEDDGEDGHDV